MAIQKPILLNCRLLNVDGLPIISFIGCINILVPEKKIDDILWSALAAIAIVSIIM
jgi:hypothetical protein